MRVTFISDRGAWVFDLPAVPSVGDTVQLYSENRKVTRVSWDLTADADTEDLITVYLGEVR